MVAPTVLNVAIMFENTEIVGSVHFVSIKKAEISILELTIHIFSPSIFKQTQREKFPVKNCASYIFALKKVQIKSRFGNIIVPCF